MQLSGSKLRDDRWSAGEQAAAIEIWGRHCSRPAVIIDADLRLIWSNPSGGLLLSTDPDLREVGGRLQLKAGTTQEFRSFLNDVDDQPCAWVLPRGEERGCIVMRVTKVLLDSNEAFVIAFSDTRGVERIWAKFGPALGLTAAEESILKRLVDGANVEAAALALGVSVATARTHIKRAYGKLGVSSREEMFAELLPFRLG